MNLQVKTNNLKYWFSCKKERTARISFVLALKQKERFREKQSIVRRFTMVVKWQSLCILSHLYNGCARSAFIFGLFVTRDYTKPRFSLIQRSVQFSLPRQFSPAKEMDMSKVNKSCISFENKSLRSDKSKYIMEEHIWLDLDFPFELVNLEYCRWKDFFINLF